MNEKAMIMKREIRTLSLYRSLMVSRHVLTFLLAVTAILFSVFNYNMAPLYTALLLNAFPPVLSYAVSDYARKSSHSYLTGIVKEEPFLLKNLKLRYKYTRIKHLSNSITYLIAILFIALWQYNFSTQENLQPSLKSIPIFILSTGLALRLLGIPFYHLKLHYDLTHNKVK